jgi:hypothetical protein
MKTMILLLIQAHAIVSVSSKMFLLVDAIPISSALENARIGILDMVPESETL